MEFGITATRNITSRVLRPGPVRFLTIDDYTWNVRWCNFWSQHLPQCSSSSAVTDREVWRVIIHWYQQLLIWPALAALRLQLFAGWPLNKWMCEANTVTPMSGATRRPLLTRHVLFLRHVWKRPGWDFTCVSLCRSQSSSHFSMIN